MNRWEGNLLASHHVLRYFRGYQFSESFIDIGGSATTLLYAAFLYVYRHLPGLLLIVRGFIIKSSNRDSGHLEKLLEVRYINEDIGKCLCIILYGVGMCTTHLLNAP